MVSYILKEDLLKVIFSISFPPSLKSSTSWWECTLEPLSIIDKDVKYCCYTSLVNSIQTGSNSLPTVLWAQLSKQFYPRVSPPIQIRMLNFFGHKNTVGDRVKSIAKVKVNKIHFSVLIWRSSQVIIEANELWQVWFTLVNYGPDSLLSCLLLFFLFELSFCFTYSLRNRRRSMLN